MEADLGWLQWPEISQLRPQILMQAGDSFRYWSENTPRCSAGPLATAPATSHNFGLGPRCKPGNSSGPPHMEHCDSTNYNTRCRQGTSIGPPSTALAKGSAAALHTTTAVGLPAAMDTAYADWLMLTISTVKVATVTPESKPCQAVLDTVPSRINSSSS